MSWRVIEGDCLEVMAGMKPQSVDAIVTDPPYGLGFMGKAWDALPPGAEWAEACLRVLKPGGHLLAFGGTRTYHRLACAIEDAGFEIRDQLQWLYGQGFPKSRNLAGEHEGWGTALKPAHEPIVLARKLLDGTVVQNVSDHGTGALNVDGCRVGSSKAVPASSSATRAMAGWGLRDRNRGHSGANPNIGRWPANVVLDEEAGQLLDAQSGERASAARFFYCAKPARGERGVANHHPTVKPLALMRWLVRLVTPRSGTVLDPFAGSGTTGCACVLEGFDFVGVEREGEYAELARGRVAECESRPSQLDLEAA